MSEVVWKGAEPLEVSLRPISDLRTHPQNPKRGDVSEIARSLERWGQVRAVLADADGTIVAGNHTFLAATELGWTHIAAVTKEFSSPDEARAYLVADNRLGDLGEYDRAELLLAVEELEKYGRWEGTGFQADDLAHLRALEAAANAPAPEPVPADPIGLVPPPELREVVLLFSEEQQAEFATHVRALRTRYGVEGVTDTVLRALHDEAYVANQTPAAA